ncbi:unnamed protein product, partial [Prorocentrum cordatum]
GPQALRPSPPPPRNEARGAAGAAALPAGAGAGGGPRPRGAPASAPRRGAAAVPPGAARRRRRGPASWRCGSSRATCGWRSSRTRVPSRAACTAGATLPPARRRTPPRPPTWPPAPPAPASWTTPATRRRVGARDRGRGGAALRRAGRRAAAGPRRRRGAHDPRCCGARARPACGCGPRRSTRASRPGAIASQFFGLPLEPGASEVVVGDALAVVRRELRALGARASAPALVAEGPGPAALGAAGWDAVVVDCFVGKGRSAELVDDIKGLLKPGGMVVHHMWHASPEDRDERVAPEFQATLQEYRRSFGPDRVEVQPIFRENPDLRLDDIILVHA